MLTHRGLALIAGPRFPRLLSAAADPPIPVTRLTFHDSNGKPTAWRTRRARATVAVFLAFDSSVQQPRPRCRTTTAYSGRGVKFIGLARAMIP